jgi:hypothetical protein
MKMEMCNNCTEMIWEDDPICPFCGYGGELFEEAEEAEEVEEAGVQYFVKALVKDAAATKVDGTVIQPLFAAVYDSVSGSIVTCTITKTTMSDVPGYPGDLDIYSEPLDEPPMQILPNKDDCKFLELIGEWHKDGKLENIEIIEVAK